MCHRISVVVRDNLIWQHTKSTLLGERENILLVTLRQAMYGTKIFLKRIISRIFSKRRLQHYYPIG